MAYSSSVLMLLSFLEQQILDLSQIFYRMKVYGLYHAPVYEGKNIINALFDFFLAGEIILNLVLLIGL